MSDSPYAAGGARKRFLLANLALVVGAAAVVAAAFYVLAPRSPESRSSPRPRTIPAERWGHATSYGRGMFVTLGPAADRRRRYELGFGRIEFISATLSVSNDHGKTFFRLHGEPMGVCGYHWQGYGVNAILATRDCVPPWAKGEGGQHAQEWLRIENLVPFARIVFVRHELRAPVLARPHT
jgi:hypothetical protein